jgi:hypothetical protein
MAIHTCLVTYIYLVTYICPTKFSDVGFCPTKFKLCPIKIKSDRTNVLSSQIFICSPGVLETAGVHVANWERVIPKVTMVVQLPRRFMSLAEVQ